MSDLPDYSGEEEQPAEDSLKRLRSMALQMIVLQSAIDDLEKQKAEKEEAYKRFALNLVPQLMKDIGVDEIKITDSFKICLKQTIQASLPQDERKETWMNYLKTTGNDGLVKREFIISYGRDETTWAETFERSLTDMLVAEHADVQKKENIHHSTLVAFITKELRDGHLDETLMKAFGAIALTSAKIESKKRK